MSGMQKVFSGDSVLLSAVWYGTERHCQSQDRSTAGIWNSLLCVCRDIQQGKKNNQLLLRHVQALCSSSVFLLDDYWCFQSLYRSVLLCALCHERIYCIDTSQDQLLSDFYRIVQIVLFLILMQHIYKSLCRFECNNNLPSWKNKHFKMRRGDETDRNKNDVKSKANREKANFEYQWFRIQRVAEP